MPFVIANMDDSDEPTMNGLWKPSIVVTKAGHKIGVVGYIWKDTPVRSVGGWAAPQRPPPALAALRAHQGGQDPRPAWGPGRGRPRLAEAPGRPTWGAPGSWVGGERTTPFHPEPTTSEEVARPPRPPRPPAAPASRRAAGRGPGLAGPWGPRPRARGAAVLPALRAPKGLREAGRPSGVAGVAGGRGRWARPARPATSRAHRHRTASPPPPPHPGPSSGFSSHVGSLPRDDPGCTQSKSLLVRNSFSSHIGFCVMWTSRRLLSQNAVILMQVASRFSIWAWIGDHRPLSA